MRSPWLAALLRALVFPITPLILLVTAAHQYLRRGWRLLMWKINCGAPSSPKPPNSSITPGGTARP
jgi:hypothetical protein